MAISGDSGGFLSWGRDVCSWHLVGRAQGLLPNIHQSVHRMVPTAKNDAAPMAVVLRRGHSVLKQWLSALVTNQKHLRGWEFVKNTDAQALPPQQGNQNSQGRAWAWCCKSAHTILICSQD